ncbi:MAG: hypothetical protein QOK35_1339 [Pseudonocardiales bacterium]|nr:hypothetical protein [Pseudonocardiales bacterium]
MNMGTHPARVAAAAVAVIAAGTTTVLALTVGTASADEPGRCTQNVNVREEADATSRIVALCEEGTKVVLGAERDHFVWLDKLQGWASTDYVKADGTAAGAAGEDSSDDDAADAADAAGDRDGASSDDAGDNSATGDDAGQAGKHSAGDPDAAGAQQSDPAGTDTAAAPARPAAKAPAPAPRLGALSGLLGR